MPRNRNVARLNRRKFLETAGAAATLGALSMPAAAHDANLRHLGTTTFVELELEHEGTPDHSITHTDDALDYKLDTDAGRLTITPMADPRVTETLRSDDAVVSTDGYHTGTGVAVDRPSNTLLTVEHGRDGTVAKQLQVETAYAPPTVSVESLTDTAVTVTAGDARATAHPGNTATTRLPDQSVRVSTPTDSVREIDDPRTGGTTLKRERRVETIDLTPVVTVHHHGRLDVYRRARGGV